MLAVRTATWASCKVGLLVFSLAFAIYFSKLILCATFDDGPLQQCFLH
jgi:hypothetical protein